MRDAGVIRWATSCVLSGAGRPVPMSMNWRMPHSAASQRVKGTPQGSPISPVLANLFLHYGLDAWMAREFPTIQFERFADDAVIHCVSERQARLVRAAVARRLAEVGLELHPD